MLSALLCSMFLTLSLVGSNACSIFAVENCDPVTPTSQAACEAPMVIRGTVLLEPDRDSPEFFFTGETIEVRVTDILKGGSAPEVPFKATISGFKPCCTCQTEAPDAGQEMLFFVKPLPGKSVTSYELSHSFLGRGVAWVTDEAVESILAGVEADLEGTDCEVLYCKQNPLCVQEGRHNCTDMVESGAGRLLAKRLCLAVAALMFGASFLGHR